MSASTSRHSSSPFASRLKEAQEEAGKNNEQLARELGVTVRLLQKYRAGTVMPRYERLAQIARILEKPVAFFYEEAV